MPTTAEIKRLRAYLNDPSPSSDGTDPFFSDDDILDIFQIAGVGSDESTTLYLAAAEGWERKASAYADLVTVQTGGSQRLMSDLVSHASKRAEHFHELGNKRDTARVGRISRPGTTIL